MRFVRNFFRLMIIALFVPAYAAPKKEMNI